MRVDRIVRPVVVLSERYYPDPFVFAIGLIWRNHVWRHYKTGRNTLRRTGLTLLFLFGPMIVSGYLIQTAVDDHVELCEAITEVPGQPGPL